MKKITLILLVFTLSLFANNLVLGVVPQQSPLVLSKKWLEVANYLKQHTGLNVIFSTEKSIPEFEKTLYEGFYDIAYMNPYHFIVANKKQNYNAFLRADKDIIGILVSKRKDINFEDKNFLKDKRFLFPAPNAFAATLLTKFELKKIYNFDIDKEAKVLYVNSHDSVYKGISRDIGYLGGGIVRTFNNFSDIKDKNSLNIVYKTKSYPSHPFAYHPRVSKDVIEKLEIAILNMPKNLKKLLSIENFKKIDSSEYDVIKDINIK